MLGVCVLASCGGGGSAEEPTQQAPAALVTSDSLTQPLGTARAAAATNRSTIVLRAASTLIDGNGAFLLVRHNGQVIANLEITSPTLTNYTIEIVQAISGGQLDIAFTNASRTDGSHARTLTLHSINVNGTTIAPNAPGVVYDLGHGLEAFDGIAVVAGTGTLTSTGALRINLPTVPSNATTAAGELTAAPGAYVDASAGSDANPGTLDRPFRTLGRLGQRQLLAGEGIFLRCGKQWRETLTLGVSQLANGTVIKSYGNDCATGGKPVISGSDLLAGGWRQQGQVWTRTVPAGTPKISRMWVGDVALRPAQWPNASDPMAVVRATYPVDPWRFWIDDREIAALAGRDLRGATVLLRTQPWRIETRQVAVSNASPGEIGISVNPEFPIEPGDAWVMQDKAWMLDAPGEFFHDVQAGTVSIVMPIALANSDPNAMTVEASVRKTALEIRGRSQVQISGIALRHAQEDGLRITDSPGVTVRDLESRENGTAGMRVFQWEPLPPGSTPPAIENGVFIANGEYGIDATYVRGASIRGNRVIDTGIGGYIGTSTAAIAAGPGATVNGNTIDGAAYAGVMFSSQGPTAITGNEISRYCLRLTDCGAIYTWSPQSMVSTEQNALIESNRIYGAVAASQGHPSLDSQVVAGIYLDDFTQRVIVRGNFLQNMPIGIFLHNAALATVENNQIWMARLAGISISMDRTDGDWSTGNFVRNNQIIPMTIAAADWPALPRFTIAHPFRFHHALVGPLALGTGRNEFSGNSVVQFNGVIPEHAQISGPDGIVTLGIENWRQRNPAEPDVQRPFTFALYNLALGPEKVLGGGFDAGLNNWVRHWNWQKTGYDAQVVSSQAGCSGPCLSFVSSERGDAVMSAPFSMRAGVPHVYSWTAISTVGDAVIGQPYIARSVTPWDQMSTNSGFVGLGARRVSSGQPLRFESFFTPKANDPAIVVLQLETAGLRVYLDSVSVREVLGWSFGQPESWSAAVVASRDSPRTVNSCSELGWSADCAIATLNGSPLSFPVTIPAGNQQLLFWSNSPFRR